MCLSSPSPFSAFSLGFFGFCASPASISQYATLCLRENPGCIFVATNMDAVTHLTDAQEWAGGGSMVGAIKGGSLE